MANIIMLNASPKGQESSTFLYLKTLAALFLPDLHAINILQTRGSQWEEVYLAMGTADYLVLGAPLYMDGLSGRLLEFLASYEDFVSGNPIYNKCPVYAVLNCGFLEAEQNDVAINILRYYFSRLGYDFRFSVAIGSGEAVVPASFGHKVAPALEYIKKDICKELKNDKNVYVQMPLSKKFFIYVAGRYWKRKGKSFGQSKKDMMAAVYETVETPKA